MRMEYLLYPVTTAPTNQAINMLEPFCVWLFRFLEPIA